MGIPRHSTNINIPNTIHKYISNDISNDINNISIRNSVETGIETSIETSIETVITDKKRLKAISMIKEMFEKKIVISPTLSLNYSNNLSNINFNGFEYLIKFHGLKKENNSQMIIFTKDFQFRNVSKPCLMIWWITSILKNNEYISQFIDHSLNISLQYNKNTEYKIQFYLMIDYKRIQFTYFINFNTVLTSESCNYISLQEFSSKFIKYVALLLQNNDN